MRRRRQKNTLLPKMLGLAVLLNAILLPILAQFGVFKSIGGRQRLTQVELVKIPPPEKRPVPPKKAVKKQAAKPHSAGRKAVRAAAVRRAAPGPPPIKVVGVTPKSGDTGGGGTDNITTSGAGPAVLPVTPPVTPAPSSAPVPSPGIVPPAAAPSPVVAAPPAPHVPVVAAAVPISQPRPEIPDELRDSDLNATFEGLFTVRPDGTAAVKLVTSSGNPTLDSLALNAARRWTFRPATRDGQPVESYLRLEIVFNVGA